MRGPARPAVLCFSLLLLFAAMAGAGAAAFAQEPAAHLPPPLPAQVPQLFMEYRIGPADVLQISVWKNEALSRSVIVRPDGMISLPLLNEIQAAGLTPLQLQDILVAKLSEFADVTGPEVAVIVAEVHSFSVSVLGEVTTPGRFELQGRATVLDMLALAGGLTEFASPSRIIVLRHDGDGMQRIPFNYDDVVSGNHARGKLFVQPGDVILVP